VDNQTGEPEHRERRGQNLRCKLRRTFVRKNARHDGPRVDMDIIVVALLIIIPLMGGIMAFTLWQQNQLNDAQKEINAAQAQIKRNQQMIGASQKKLAFVERQDRINTYQSGFRFCARDSVNRAAVQWFASSRLPALFPADQRRLVRQTMRSVLRRLQRRSGLPVLNCEPNVRGLPAQYESPKAQAEFVRRWRDMKLTDAELGICRIPIGTVTDPRRCVN
jgi:hypothetical protein